MLKIKHINKGVNLSMNIHQLHRKILTMLIISLVLYAPAATYASVAMTLPQYVSEILLNNHSLRAGMKNVEADYYSVLASVPNFRTIWDSR